MTGYGPMHVHINYDDFGPTKMFCHIAPMGTEISGLTAALGIIISKYFEAGGEPTRLLKHLNSIKGDKPYGIGAKRIDSIPHAIAKVLRDHLIKTGKLAEPQQVLGLAETAAQTTLAKREEHLHAYPQDKLYCPKCYSPNVAIMAGCSEPTCLDCGYSKCG